MHADYSTLILPIARGRLWLVTGLAHEIHRDRLPAEDLDFEVDHVLTLPLLQREPRNIQCVEDRIGH